VNHDSKAKMSQSLEETKNTIINLNIQLEEARRIEEVVRIWLKEKEENYEKSRIWNCFLNKGTRERNC